MKERFPFLKKLGPALARIGGVLEDRALYFALAACFMLVGGAAWYYQGRVARQVAVPPETTVAPAAAAPDTVQTLDEAQREAAAGESAAGGAQAAPRFIWPVSGREILAEYSGVSPQWSDTLGQWQLHEGVDIAAPQGETVRAALDGTVIASYKDTLWGYTIELSHEGGYTTRYCNLATLNAVEAGERVTAGQTISSVGASAAAETAMASHLHFELWQNGAWALDSVQFEEDAAQ